MQSFDSETGIIEVYEPEDGPGDTGPLVKREKYHPETIVVVDDIARPDEKQLGDIRQKHTGKMEREK